MIEVIELLLIVFAVGLLVPAAVLLVECAASLWPARPVNELRDLRPRVVVIVPAHNEAGAIDVCLAALAPQLATQDRVIVVADNCVDDTAERARAHGAHVLERNALERPGKGHALLHALKALAAAPPDVVIIVDADSVPQAGLVEMLAYAAAQTGRPVQAAYFPALPSQPGPLDEISALAFVAKNVTRPRGLVRLGLPCLLTGTGMAFPWEVIRAAPIAEAKTAEDMRLAIDVSLAGYAPTFCPAAHIVGPLERWKDGVTLQRARWEHGHLETLVERVVPLLLTALRRRSLSLVALALELSVPPLSLWALLWTIAALLAGGLALFGGRLLPLGLILFGGLLVVGAVLIAWVRDGRALVPARVLIATGWYVARKLPLYASFPRRRQSQWTLAGFHSNADTGSTDRIDGVAAASPPAVRIGSVRIHALSEADVVRHVIDRLGAGEGGWIITLNLDHLWHLARDAEYATLCARGTLAVADGMPLVWVSRLQGTPLPERVAGSYLIESLSAAAAQHGKSICLVGGLSGDAEAAATVLRARYPALRIAGVCDARIAAQPAALADDLREMKADIVYLSLGKIAEERLIERLRGSLPDVWFMGVGTSFAFLSGRVKRAPRWMRRSGLEWMHRWTQEPARLTTRYLRCMPLAIRLLGSAAVQGGRKLVSPD